VKEEGLRFNSFMLFRVLEARSALSLAGQRLLLRL
jgi:hypothetical protein